MSRRMLILVTSHDRLGTTGKATGIWAEELAVPYYSFADRGFDIEIASTAGGKVPFDPGSVNGNKAAAVERLLADESLQKKLTNSVRVDSLREASFDAIFLPGGHGTMWDLPQNAAVARVVGHHYAHGKVVAAVCHGSAGFIGAKTASGRPIVEGKRINAFSNEEEEAAGLTQTVPFLLETRLRELGAQFERGSAFQPYAIRDGNLVTGQNPMSSSLVARHIFDALGVAAPETLTSDAA